MHTVNLCAVPIPGLEFEQTLGWQSCAVEMAHAAERGLVWTRRWLGVVSGVVCQIRIVGSVQFPPVTRIKSLRRPNKSGLCLEVNCWWGKHKVVVDEGGFSVFCVEVDWGLSFLSVHLACAAQCSTAGAALALILRTKLFS